MRCALSDGVAYLFLECGGNSAPLYSKEPIQGNVQALHGLASCAEWTGVMLSTLLEEIGIDPKAKWFIAEGADAPTMNRSVPLAKAMDDAMIALYQNGERLNPANGYPMRLLLPGYEGNMNVKWLRRIKLVEQPVMAIYETKHLHDPAPERQGLPVLFPAGSEVVHHAAVAGPEPEAVRPSTRSPVSHSPVPAASPGSWSRPMAVRVGRARRCRSRY